MYQAQKKTHTPQIAIFFGGNQALAALATTLTPFLSKASAHIAVDILQQLPATPAPKPHSCKNSQGSGTRRFDRVVLTSEFGLETSMDIPLQVSESAHDSNRSGKRFASEFVRVILAIRKALHSSSTVLKISLK